MRVDPYVSVSFKDNKPKLCVEFGDDDKQYYDLTEESCRFAVRDLYASGAMRWMTSSTVDHPKEIDPNCEINISEIMSDELDNCIRPSKEVVEMMVSYCESPEFQSRLTNTQKETFAKIANDTRNRR